MVDGAASGSSEPPVRGGGWRQTLADPAVVAIAAYATVAIVAAIAAYLAIFTEFAPYDDEGTLLVTLKAFVHGGVLYRDIYSEYGPFYYELFGGLFALTGHAVTTDASRSIVIVVWVATSFLYGLVAQKLTGRLALGIAGMIAAFGALYVLISEPMHPQGLCVLLLGGFTLLAVAGPTRRVLLAGGGGGTLLAALILTKANLGVFAVAAVALAAVMTCEPFHRRWLRWPVILAFLAMPLAITARDLSTAWVRELMALEVLAGAAVIVAAWRLRPERGEDSRDLSRWLIAATVGFVVAFVAILGIIFLTGPTPSDVYDGVVTQAFRVRDVLITQFPFPPAAVDWGIFAVAAAALTSRLRAGEEGKPSVWPGLLRAVTGVTIWLTLARIAPVGLSPSGGNPNTVPMVLAWVATIPPAGVREAAHRRFLRVMLPALAVAETLQVYPVAGSQMGIAALTFVPVGAICFGDALTSLRAWSSARGGMALERLGVVVAVATVALAAEFGVDSMLRTIATNAVAYHDQQPLPFPGASTLRLTSPEVETYAQVVDLLHSHRCRTFVGYPNVDSLYLWSGIEAPPPAAPGAWIYALDAEQQQRIVDEVRASPRPCAIRSYARAEAWLHGKPPPDTPLVHYIFDDFRPVAKVGDFEFLLPKRSATAP